MTDLAQGGQLDNPQILDGATFEIIVHRLRQPKPGGEWLVRVYQGADHVHSAEGGVSLNVGLAEANMAMRRWLDQNGAR